MLPSINISHLVKLVPHHLLRVETGGGEERKIILALSQLCTDTVFSAAAVRNTADSTIALIALCTAKCTLTFDMLSQKEWSRTHLIPVNHNILPAEILHTAATERNLALCHSPSPIHALLLCYVLVGGL